MRDNYDDSPSVQADDGESYYGVKARPQLSRVAKKADKRPRSKKIKRSSPVGGLHQRRNKRISW